MKTRLAAFLLLCVLMVAMASGCLYKEYAVGGAVVDINQLTVKIVAQLWYVENSGPIQHIKWIIDWGDGHKSYTDDGLPTTGGGLASPTNPLTMMNWWHDYEVAGDYTISMTCGGSAPKTLVVSVE